MEIEMEAITPAPPPTTSSCSSIIIPNDNGCSRTVTLNQNNPMFDHLIQPPSIIQTKFSNNTSSSSTTTTTTSFRRDISFNNIQSDTNNNSNYIHHLPAGMKTTKTTTADIDTEISIFEAERYFNNSIIQDKENNNKNNTSSLYNTFLSKLTTNKKLSDASSIPRFSSVSSIDESSHNNYRGGARSFHAGTTPTASSEASWNSQTGLLKHLPPTASSIPVSTNIKEGNTKTRRSFSISSPRWLLGRNCPCSGKKSVQVKKPTTNSESRTSRIFRLDRSNSVSATATRTTSATAIAPTSSTPCSVSSYPTSRQSSPKNSTGKRVVIPSLPTEFDRNFIPQRQELDSYPNKNTVPTTSNGISPKNSLHSIGNNGRSHGVVGITTSGFTFPILNNNNTNTSVKKKMMFNVIEDPPRESLEVYQPREDPRSSVIVKERQSYTFPGSPRSRRASYDDEICSDASSDLFEIESFSTHQTSTSYQRRESLDDASSFNARRFGLVGTGVNDGVGRNSLDVETRSVTPTECYAPSEVSVDWSVTTAEGFDRASLSNFSVSASEVGGYVAAAAVVEKGLEESVVGGSNRRGNGGGGGGGLLSCRCEKTVSVVGPRPGGPIRRVANSGGGGDVGRRSGMMGVGALLPTNAAMKHVKREL